MNLKKITEEIQKLTEQVRSDHFDNTAERFNRLDLKAKNQLVTDMDILVEQELVKGLRDILPGAGFLTEEKTTEEKDNKGLKWIIDPIDGTTNFVHGIPVYAISIGLEDEQGIVMGVIYELNRGEFFSASRKNGAFLNGAPIHVSDHTTLEDTLVATGFPYYDYSRTPQYLKVLEQFMRNTRGVRRLGSAAVDLAYVACGRFDTFYEYSLSPWDVAAGSLIVQEAGGIVSDFNGGNNHIYGRSIIASQPKVYNDVLGIIQEHFS